MPTECGFFLDYEEEEDVDAKPSRRRKPYRYRWPDEVRDDVLARLLALNAERAAEEKRLGLGKKGKSKFDGLELREQPYLGDLNIG